MSFDVNVVRRQFPSLNRPAIFLDNPAGTQIAKPSLDRINRYLLEYNANHEGMFETSRRSDEVLHEAHAAMADFLNAARPEEIIFGNNMTTLTLHISRSLARTLQPGDNLLVTRLDHDANISPWMLIAEDKGCNLLWVDIDVEDGTLDLDDFARALEKKPKIAAFGYASNLLGTINPVKQLTKMAKDAGALVYIDAVQYAPHGPIDVQDIGCDFLVCSSYKFFGPHAGALYGRYDLLNELRAYKVRPASDELPYKFETGTQNHEGIAGVLGALEYLEWLGMQFGADQESAWKEAGFTGRRLELKKGMSAMRAYESELSRALIKVVESVPGTRIYGVTDRDRLDERVPTVSFTLEGRDPEQIADAIGKQNIYVWNGHNYALAIVERLGLLEAGGMVRVGPVHYNTVDEIERFGEVLKSIV
ncbi:MAG: cysteine desulfurase-like protein [Anaerolineales bacterium]|nr:cysteine desulfurase-like protein [Anaerolineae bacterium]PWB75371.1 MAG: cysteine desulfurase-like protein [Anaerolineales bacterium]